MEGLDAALVCAICQCRLIQPAGKTDSSLDPFAINPCGHVFHRQCTIEWIDRHPTCPSCRCTVENSRKLFFAQDEHPADEFGDAASGSNKRGNQIRPDGSVGDVDEAPWYEKYATALTFAGGAIVGAIGAAVVASKLSQNTTSDEEEKKKKKNETNAKK